MAHFAWLDESNNVYQVSVVNNSDVGDLPFPDSEPVGITYLTSVHGEGKTWKQTSYNGNFRGKYAAIGDVYDAGRDEFINPFDDATDPVVPDAEV